MLKYYLVTFIFLLSCDSNEKVDKEIQSKNSFRKINNLLVINTLLLKDSTEKFTRDEIGDYSFYEKIDKPSKDSTYILATFYSSINSPKLQKIVYTEHNQNSIKLVEETDIYRKRVNDSIYSELIFNYDYLKNRKSLRIDSIPTVEFMNKRKKDLDSMAKWAKSNGYKLCGTAANEILNCNLPERHTIVDTNDVELYISQFE